MALDFTALAVAYVDGIGLQRIDGFTVSPNLAIDSVFDFDFQPSDHQRVRAIREGAE